MGADPNDNVIRLIPEGRGDRPATAERPTILPLHVEDLTFMAGGQVLVNRACFRLEAGNRTIILGPNGAGKSLCLRLIHGLIEPSAGSISWLGSGASQALPPRPGDGGGEALGDDNAEGWQPVVWQAMVFQRPIILRRSALANVRYALKVHGVGRDEAEHRARLALKRTGLESKAGQPAQTLSGGEQQRLALARAWALNPEVLFLDEPSANLDPATTNQVEGIINRMHHDGTKIVMTTHDIAQAQRLADEVLFLYRGEVYEHTPAAEFFHAAHTDEARAFLSGRLLG